MFWLSLTVWSVLSWVLLHSHLLLCLPVLDSRQVHFAGWQWALFSGRLHPSSSWTHTPACTSRTSLPASPLSPYHPASTAQFICPAVCVWEVNYLYCQPPFLRFRLNSSSSLPPRCERLSLHSLSSPLSPCATCVAPQMQKSQPSFCTGCKSQRLLDHDRQRQIGSLQKSAVFSSSCYERLPILRPHSDCHQKSIFSSYRSNSMALL